MVIVACVDVILDASEELFKFIELCNPDVTIAADELLEVIVADRLFTDEFNDADAL